MTLKTLNTVPHLPSVTPVYIGHVIDTRDFYGGVIRKPRIGTPLLL